MSDLFQGQTMTEMYKFISAGAAHTFTFNFQPDKVTFVNLTAWAAGTDGLLPISTWYRDETTAAHAYQQQIVDAAGANFNFLDPGANGFTDASTDGGPVTTRKTITGITAADPCVVTAVSHGFQDDDIVRITDLGSEMPVARGMDELDGNRYKITYINANSFSLNDPISGAAIDSTAYTAYVTGGFVTLETRVIRPNNPYVGAYTANAFLWDAPSYQLTAGTSVMGANDDSYIIEVVKFGLITDLGDLA